VTKSKKARPDWQIAKDHEILGRRIRKSFEKYKKKDYFKNFRATRHCGDWDSHGVDWIIYFRSNGHGKGGSVLLQEKRSKDTIKKHLNTYPTTPAFLVKIGDQISIIDYIVVSLVLSFRAYNRDKESVIKREIDRLKSKISKKRRDAMGKRLWYNNFSPEI